VTEMVPVRVWRVYAWGKGRWTLRSTHAGPDDAAEHAEYWRHRGFSSKYVEATVRRPMPSQAPAPSAAQQHREQQSDRMVLRRQAFQYFKSGANGTEIRHIDKDDKCPNLGHPAGKESK